MAGLNAEYIDSLVVKEEYHRLTERLTVCVLTLNNGYEVVGQSACINPKDYNEIQGKIAAYNDAIDKIWDLEAYVARVKFVQESNA